MEYNVGDIIESKKCHPCGNNELEIIRVGVDFKFKCMKCNHVITLDRQKALKIIKRKKQL
ncbi:MAG: DUF951 domain-containing protein [Clostridia bacterium]|nr:DUF951 domain-containing protein [Clostridia bacterium]